MKRFYILVIALVMIVSCTEADRSQIGSYGEKHKITFYPPVGEVRVWYTDGKVIS
jgi:hypothetical protein